MSQSSDRHARRHTPLGPPPPGVAEALARSAQPQQVAFPVPETTYPAIGQPQVLLNPEHEIVQLAIPIPTAQGAPAHIHIFGFSEPMLDALIAMLADAKAKIVEVQQLKRQTPAPSAIVGPDGQPLGS